MPDAVIVLDEHLTRVTRSLRDRGVVVKTVADFHATSTLDPDVIRAVANGLPNESWVLVTMDGTIVDEYPGFEWERYAIAWIKIDPRLSGIEVEHAKTDVVNRHAHSIIEQRPPDHHTYFRDRHYRHAPSLIPARR